MADHSTEFEAKSPAQLADEIARVDTVKLNFGGEVYGLTKREIEWLVLGLRGIGTAYTPS